MKIKCAEFSLSAARFDQIPTDELPHLAFAGRSNVGKSSLINSLLNRKKLVYISSTPGKTRLLNFFLVNNDFYFVDLPGYGYAKASKSEKKSWKNLIENYLLRCSRLKGVVVIVDIRHPVPENDLELIDWLILNGIPCVIAATKADKLSANRLAAQIAVNNKILKNSGIAKIYPFSAKTGFGKVELWKELTNLLIGRD
jgi:GTP-binding protein